ncbi:MAG: WYL domain-containing protein [Acidimicrobiia bacterium]|nr:WYL domain-containing protein [Acidimicrobiia bacterium]
MKNVIERLLNLLAFLLTTERPATAEEIRFKVKGYDNPSDDAFHRMFERDKDQLRSLGIGLEIHTDSYGMDPAYVLDPDSYAIDDPELTDEERAALALSVNVVRVGGQPAGPEALFKLGGIAWEGGGEPLGADLGGDIEDAVELFEAIRQQSRLRFDYRGSERRVDPYTIARRRGHWYLLGNAKGETRVFRVDRMTNVKVGPAGGFERPVDFDPGRELDLHPWEGGSDPEQTAVVRFDPEVAWWASRILHEPHTPGEPLETTMRVGNQDAFIGFITGFGAEAEVLEPPELRSKVIERVRGALKGVGTE